MPKTEIIKVNSENPEPHAIKKAAQILKRGGLVAFPTETVYGVGANLRNKTAVERLYEIKDRPEHKPFTIAISDSRQLTELDCEVSPYAFRFTEHFWPGPLTLILWTKDEKKLGIRMPDNKVALALLREADVPVALPSANISGNPAPTTADEVLCDLEGKIEAILDSGKTKIGVESTVVDLTAFPYRILREGAIKEKELGQVPRKSILFVCTGNSCRSVMAEGLLKKLLKKKSRIDVEVLSAGIAGIEGFSPTEETIQVMEKEGIDVEDFKTKSLTIDFIKRSDLILVMQNMHKKEILSKVPHVKGKVYLLREFTKDEIAKEGLGSEIPDPITRPIEVYRRIFGIIKRNIEKLVEMI